MRKEAEREGTGEGKGVKGRVLGGRKRADKGMEEGRRED